ncbi:hypothetical protein [Actinoplanes awajinensis]|uniref:hypothetical protein n=1 Tax=Actinoplanes awajinensis TaxID=135946 RepID=UPI000A5C1518|nr:hypothetical protein [Actinoplanes awajinensis]
MTAASAGRREQPQPRGRAGLGWLLRGAGDDWIADFDEGLTWLLDGFARTLPGGG